MISLGMQMNHGQMYSYDGDQIIVISSQIVNIFL